MVPSHPDLEDASSRILCNDNGLVVLVGSTMDWTGLDWLESTEQILTVPRRAMVRDGGLTGHKLYLNAADSGSHDPSRPGLQSEHWQKYVLVNVATVKEALAHLNDAQMVLVETRSRSGAFTWRSRLQAAIPPTSPGRPANDPAKICPARGLLPARRLLRSPSAGTTERA